MPCGRGPAPWTLSTLSMPWTLRAKRRPPGYELFLLRLRAACYAATCPAASSSSNSSSTTTTITIITAPRPPPSPSHHALASPSPRRQLVAPAHYAWRAAGCRPSLASGRPASAVGTGRRALGATREGLPSSAHACSSACSSADVLRRPCQHIPVGLVDEGSA